MRVWQYEHSIETEARPEAVYQLYSDSATWPDWDEGIVQATLDGSFALCGIEEGS